MLNSLPAPFRVANLAAIICCNAPIKFCIFSKLPQQVSKKFGLVSKALPSGTGETSSGGPGYVFNGVYQPLACKIVQETLRPTNPKVGITDSLKEFQIPHKLITGEPFVLFNLKNKAIWAVLVAKS